jgi:hypothetical protein
MKTVFLVGCVLLAMGGWWDVAGTAGIVMMMVSGIAMALGLPRKREMP